MTSDSETYRHHPLSHRITSSTVLAGPTPTEAQSALVYEFLANVHKWYNARTAEALLEWRSALDAFGNSLLDHTVVPVITETGDAAHQRSAMPALILGGRALGMIGGQFQHLSQVRYNSLWATIAQALFQSSDPFAMAEFADEVFVKEGAVPIPGLWAG